MRRHARRTPRGYQGFSWGKVVTDDAVSYRLFFRDSVGACHVEQRVFTHQHTRRGIATALKGAKAQLRWKVDQLEFARLGMRDTTPAPGAIA